MSEEIGNANKNLSNDPLTMKTVITRETLAATTDLINKMKLTADAKMRTVVINADGDTMRWLTEKKCYMFF